MSIYVPSQGPSSWQSLLASPEKHWRAGYSAHALATCWEAAQGKLPGEIADLLSDWGPGELLFAFPEHQVRLPGSPRGPSQNDVFALLRLRTGTAAITVEGKVSETFDLPIGAWLEGASPSKLHRLRALGDLLGIRNLERHPDIKYQLVHRTASALIEADRFLTERAAMLVHSFSPINMWFEDFAAFASLLGFDPEPGKLGVARCPSVRPLYLGWAKGDLRYPAQVPLPQARTLRE